MVPTRGSTDRGGVHVWVIVVAAGTGSRYGGPKQLAPLGGRRVLDWSMAAATAAGDGVVLVVAAEHRAEIEAVSDRASAGRVAVVTGGATRSASVRAGLAAVPPEVDVVVVHDAARPLASSALFDRVIDAVVDGADGAVPGVPVVDTIREVDAGVIDRDTLVAVQTPQAFRAESLRRAHRGDPEASDDASLIEAVGGKVVVVTGDPVNRKITTPLDLVVARAILQHGEQNGGEHP